jgi:hypothetical protein
MFKAIIAAAFLTGCCSVAFASPLGLAAADASIGTGSDLAHIAKRDKERRHWRGDRHGHRWHRHRHWRHRPPPGWRRYHARPWDWRQRGCMTFGPVWFCP